MGKLNKLTDVAHCDIMDMYATGSSLKVIATKYDCTPPTVATFLRKNGVTVRGKGKRKKVTVAESVAVEDDLYDIENEVIDTAIME